MTGSKRIRGVVFDKDGTLFNFQASWSKWATDVLVGLSRNDLRLAWNVGGNLGFDLQTQQFDSESPLIANTPEAILEALQREYSNWSKQGIQDLVTTCTTNAEMVEAVPLKALIGGLRSQGFTLGIATNDAEATANAQLSMAGVIDLFDFVAGYDSVNCPKPEPDMLLAYCEHSGIPPSEAVMVGDSLFDIVAGRKANMRTVGVLTGGETRHRLSAQAEAVLDDIGVLPEWLAETNRHLGSGTVIR